MNSNSSHNRSSDTEATLDRLFQVRDLASRDFSARTLAVVRTKARRAKVIRFSAWAAVAASLALVLGLNLMTFPGDAPQLADSGAEPIRPAVEQFAVPADFEVGEEVTLALQTNGLDATFYSHARALEELLSDAAVLTVEDGADALDFLISFAGS